MGPIGALATATLIAVTAVLPAADDSGAAASTCGRGAGARALTAAFAHRVEGIAGADYQRAVALPDGRVLWTFQDAFVARPGKPDRLVHNVGLVQRVSCFRLLRSGSTAEPRDWIAPRRTRPYRRWFWPLAATTTSDGTVALFIAEMHERGPRYLSRTVPVATWLARLDPVTLRPVSVRPAPDPGRRLYGWSVASDTAYTYLYAHCYRQFGHGSFGHAQCTADVTVARTRRGDLDGPLRYWNGRAWVADPAAAVNIAPHTAPDGTRRGINPMQIAHVDGRWIAATKEGDWWGDRIYLDRARSPVGPWRTSTMLRPAPVDANHNTYFASLLPTRNGRVILGISNNRWDGARSTHYRPTFRSYSLSRWS